MGTPVGYKLVPSASFPAMLDPSSPVFQRAQVIGHTLWVTPYDADERWPCGEFVNQSATDEGLPVWTAKNRSIENNRPLCSGTCSASITSPGRRSGRSCRRQDLFLAQTSRFFEPEPRAGCRALIGHRSGVARGSAGRAE